jgi:DNA primase
MSKEDELLAVLKHYDIDEPRSGQRKMRCPVHDDSNPSATVNREKGLWHCFACGAGGDGIALLQANEGWSYGQAKDFLATLTGDTPASEVAHRKPKQSKQSKRWIPPKLRRSV